MALTDDQLVDMYRAMLRIRRFEERAVEGVTRGEIPGSIHSSIGQEATAVGACSALRMDDYMTGSHRSHGHVIAKGSSLDRVMAELMGRSTGVCKGKGGSMHLADIALGSLGACGIVGASLPLAVGAGLSIQLRGTDQVCLAFFGDGGANIGTFHESINLAAVWRLPVIFLCENNGYALTTAATSTTASGDIAGRGKAYGIPGVSADGQDTVAVRSVVSEAVDRARGGHGPSLIEARTYRYREHAELGALELGYRGADEIAEWRQRDPVALLRSRLLASGALDETAAEQIDDETRHEVALAAEFALQSPLPDAREAYQDVFTGLME
jgi:pyruvate dehydrogenase E1 component alpha subunit